MQQVKLKAEVIDTSIEVVLEFGRTQAMMKFSDRGTIQRTLKLKEGDLVEVTVKKVSK